MKGNVAAVYCEFKYSGVAESLLALAVLATLAVLAATPFPPPLRAALGLAVAAFGCRGWHALREVRSVRLDGLGEIELHYRNGRIAVGSVRAGSFVAPWLTLVRWRPAGGIVDRTVPVLPGMLPAEDFRDFRVLLRWA